MNRQAPERRPRLPWPPASRWRWLAALGLSGAFSAVAWGSAGDDVERCLAANDVPCAEAALKTLSDANAPTSLALAAEVDFYAGRYLDAETKLQKAVDGGYQDKYDDLDLYHRTADTMADWAQVQEGRYIVRYRPGLDAILIDDAIDAVSKAEHNIAPLLGGAQPGPTIVEIYPDGKSFIYCSSLTYEDVTTTGVVALSKWSRLLVTSPRALGRGYEWKDTAAHEYTHLVVAHQTDDRAPVWLQEAIAKYLDNRWRDGKDHWRLSVGDQGLLARALREEDMSDDQYAQIADQDEDGAKGLVSFEEMHPSLAKLPTAERASLAYAQLSSLMAYSFKVGGEDVLKKTLPLVKQGMDPRDALAKGAGAKSFDDLLAGWKAWVKTLGFVDRTIPAAPTTLDGAAEESADPVLSAHQDAVRYMRVGDLLRERKHPQAALVEYAKAVVPDEPQSPLLANRMARAWLDLGDAKSAKAALDDALRDYPEFPAIHETLGEILEKQGQTHQALQAYEDAADLDPFDQDVQQALVRLDRAAGDEADAKRHDATLTLIRRGGQEETDVQLIYPGLKRDRHDDAYKPIEETRGGGGEADQRVGQAFPDLRLMVDGKPVMLSSLQGPVVVDLWATWCGPCKASLPHLDTVAKTYGPKGVQVVAASVDNNAALVDKFFKGQPKPTYTVAFAGEKTLSQVGADSIPATFVLDAQHKVAAFVGGYAPGDDRIEQALDAVLAGQGSK